MNEIESDYFMGLLQEYFELLKPNYPGWVGLKWDMQKGKISNPEMSSVTLDTDLFATSQYMYYFWTGEGGGGGVSGKINNPPLLEDPQTSFLAKKQLELFEKLTPVVEGTTYVNYPLNDVKYPLIGYYYNYLPFLVSLKKRYDPDNFWHQPPNHRLTNYDTQLWRSDGLCGIGLPTIDTSYSICDPLGNTPVCDQRDNSVTYRRCINKNNTPVYDKNLIDWSKRVVKKYN
jgi:hypothetical protein